MRPILQELKAAFLSVLCVVLGGIGLDKVVRQLSNGHIVDGLVGIFFLLGIIVTYAKDGNK